MTNPRITVVRPADAPDGDQADIDVLVHRFFGRPPAAGAGAEAAPVGGRRDFDGACDLLDRAARAFEVLAERCRTLEGDLAAAGERARAQTAAHEDVVGHWKRLTSGLQAQLQASAQAAASLEARREAVEARAAAAEARAVALEREAARSADQAASAQQLSAKLHDRVVAAFGLGSRLHAALDAEAPGVAPG